MDFREPSCLDVGGIEFIQNQGKVLEFCERIMIFFHKYRELF
jgi:hypothetical protein